MLVVAENVDFLLEEEQRDRNPVPEPELSRVLGAEIIVFGSYSRNKEVPLKNPAERDRTRNIVIISIDRINKRFSILDFLISLPKKKLSVRSF